MTKMMSENTHPNSFSKLSEYVTSFSLAVMHSEKANIYFVIKKR